MKLTFLGAAKTVTGSCFLLEANNKHILIDCGMFQGADQEENLNYEPWPFDVTKIDYLLLTHAHIDHSGKILNSVKMVLRKNLLQQSYSRFVCHNASRQRLYPGNGS